MNLALSFEKLKLSADIFALPYTEPLTEDIKRGIGHSGINEVIKFVQDQYAGGHGATLEMALGRTMLMRIIKNF